MGSNLWGQTRLIFSARLQGDLIGTEGAGLDRAGGAAGLIDTGGGGEKAAGFDHLAAGVVIGVSAVLDADIAFGNGTQMAAAVDLRSAGGEIVTGAEGQVAFGLDGRADLQPRFGW